MDFIATGDQKSLLLGGLYLNTVTQTLRPARTEAGRVLSALRLIRDAFLASDRIAPKAVLNQR